MTSMNYHLIQIAENAKSITTLYFRPPGSFTNAVIQKPEITNVIRDADTNEQLLFKVEDRSAQKISRNKNMFSADISRALDNTYRHLSDQENGGFDDVNIDILCAAINDIAQDYPIPGIEQKTFTYQTQWRALNDKISHFEDVVESQRQRLNILNKDLESQAEEDSTNTVNSATSIADQIRELKTRIASQREELEIKESQLGRH